MIKTSTSLAFGITFLTSEYCCFGQVFLDAQSSVLGTTMVSRNGTVFNAYLGIPFAEAPIGILRFKPPKEMKLWSGILNATIPGQKCIHKSRSGKLEGSENCLNLNIYTPQHVIAGDNVPVIVHIFGGRFKDGSNLDNGPHYMMDKRIVIVIPNYRLGALGFLSTGDKVISGNMGLKDQVVALKWVHKNIRSFGGDPNKVTLYGHSSGAMCAHFHALTPLCVGLFHRLISQSGSAYSPLAFFDKEMARAVGFKFAEMVGCNQKVSEALLECLSVVNPSSFPLIEEKMLANMATLDVVFRATVEATDAEFPFLTATPTSSAIFNSDYEWLIGVTSNESVCTSARMLDGGGLLGRQLDAEYKKLFPSLLLHLHASTYKNGDQISTVIRQHYFGNASISAATTTSILDMFSEAQFVRGANELIRSYKGKRYVYLFDYWANFSEQTALVTNYPIRLGVGHVEDLNLIYRREYTLPFLTNQDLALGAEIITRLINFAYSGDPNKPFPINESMFSSWQPVTSSKIEYLRIKLNGTMETGFYEESYQFWKKISMMSEY